MAGTTKAAGAKLIQRAAGAQNSQAGDRFIPPGYAGRFEALMEVVRFGPEFLSQAEFLALLFHAERSLTYDKSADTASYSQMTDGIRKRDGKWIRGGSGLKKTAATQANKALDARGLLFRRTRQSNRGGHQPTEYSVNWKAVHALFTNKIREKNTPLVRQTNKPLSAKRTPPLFAKRTHRVFKSSSQSERLQSESAQPSKKVAVVGPSGGVTNPISESQKVDEDKPKTPVTNESAADQIKRIVLERDGVPMSERDWWQVTAEAETRGRTLEELADLLRNNNGRWRNSTAACMWLLRNSRSKSTPIKAAASPQAELGSACAIRPCMGRQPDGKYCNCAMGIDLRRAEARRKPSIAEEPHSTETAVAV